MRVAFLKNYKEYCRKKIFIVVISVNTEQQFHKELRD